MREPVTDQSRTDNAPEAYYGLPGDVVYCKNCVISNQRPSSYPEFRHSTDRKAPTIHIDEDGLCDACKFNEQKNEIDWETRERELLELLDKHRRSDGGHDCIFSGSGGKDSCYGAHILKYKYGMNPLTATWPPILYTDIGLRNFNSWIEIGGFDNITFKPNGRVQKLLTRLSTENLLHPFQTFILGQKNVAPKIALKYGIPLVFYGEPEAECGNPIAETLTSIRDRSYFAMKNLDEVMLAGVPVTELMERHDLSLNDLSAYFPPTHDELEKGELEVHYMGYYVRWTPQEAYYYAVEHCGFAANPGRSEGTYSKYSSLDDKIDGFHYYTTWIKFGIGRATYDASQEIRNHHLTREEGVSLVKQFDGEFPELHFAEVMEYIEMDPDHFLELCNKSRSPHLWVNEGNRWRLRHPIWEG